MSPNSQPPRFNSRSGAGQSSRPSRKARQESEQEQEVDLTKPGPDIEVRSRKGETLVRGVRLIQFILGFLFLLTITFCVFLLIFLGEVGPEQKIAHIESILKWLIGVIVATLASLLAYLFKPRRKR